MKTLAKTLLQGVAVIAIGFATLTLNNVYAETNNDYDESYDSSGNDDVNSEGDNNGENIGDGEEQEQEPALPTLQVQVQMNMSGEYKTIFNKEKGKFQVFLRALNDTKNSTKGSKPVKLDLNGGDAAFESASANGSIDQPQGVLVALSKVGNTYQYFCSGKGIKDGVIKGFPQGIKITLTNGNKPYKTAAGTLRNDSYPNCQVEAAN
jgi:hypothetical protein